MGPEKKEARSYDRKQTFSITIVQVTPALVLIQCPAIYQSIENSKSYILYIFDIDLLE